MCGKPGICRCLQGYCFQITLKKICQTVFSNFKTFIYPFSTKAMEMMKYFIKAEIISKWMSNSFVIAVEY